MVRRDVGIFALGDGLKPNFKLGDGLGLLGLCCGLSISVDGPIERFFGGVLGAAGPGLAPPRGKKIVIPIID